MPTLKTLTLSFLSAAGIAMLATSASADLWHRETILGRDMTFFTPREMDLSGAAATPAVFVFDEEAPTGADLASRFRLWEHSVEQGYKAVFVGGVRGGATEYGIPSADHLFRTMINQSKADQFVDPRNTFVVAFGQSAERALRYACDTPGQIRGIVAIDFEGFASPVSCTDTSGLFVLSIHDGQPASQGTARTSHDRDFSQIEAALSPIEAAGANVQRYALEGADERYPDISAKFFDQSGVTLEKLSALFIGRIMVK